MFQQWQNRGGKSAPSAILLDFSNDLPRSGRQARLPARSEERPWARNPAPAAPRGKRDYIFRKIDGPTPLSTLGGDSSHEIFTMEVAVSAHMICHCGRLNSFEAIKTRAELAKRISDLWTGTLQLDGVWIVQSDRTSDEIRDALMPA